MASRIDQRPDGRYALRFERRLAHPREKVWRALTETDQLRHWFVEILDYDRSRLAFGSGAEVLFVPKPELDLPIGHGRVTAADAPRLLEYTWDGEVLRWELEADGDHACVLRFTNLLSDQETATAVEPGWQLGLDQLAAHLAA